jgi:hypothetical protein
MRKFPIRKYEIDLNGSGSDGLGCRFVQLHLAGLDYTMCVRREAGSCCIRYFTLFTFRLIDGTFNNGRISFSHWEQTSSYASDKPLIKPKIIFVRIK